MKRKLVAAGVTIVIAMMSLFSTGVTVFAQSRDLDNNNQNTIEINDFVIEDAIRKEINKPTGDILISDIEKITQLDLSGCNISDLSPLSNLTSLSSLDLSSIKISDISVISNLKSLTYLNLDYNKINDISAISNLKKLNFLDIKNNPLNNKETPNAVHKSELDFTIGRQTHEVWVVEEPDEVLMGDIDGNDNYNSLDFALMRAYLLGKVKDI